MSANTHDVIEVAQYSGRCALCREPIEPGSRYRRRGHNHCEHLQCPPPSTTAPTTPAGLHAVPPSPDRQRDVRIEDGRRLYLNGELVVERPLSRREAGDEIAAEAIAEFRAGRAPDLRTAIYRALRRDPARAFTYDPAQAFTYLTGGDIG